MVNEFVGDGVMALSGLESNVDIGCRKANTAARAMRDRPEYLNRTPAVELNEPLRIGIHAGPVILGKMGNAQAQDGRLEILILIGVLQPEEVEQVGGAQDQIG